MSGKIILHKKTKNQGVVPSTNNHSLHNGHHRRVFWQRGCWRVKFSVSSMEHKSSTTELNSVLFTVRVIDLILVA